MMKKIVLVLALGLFTLNYTACTSGDSSTDEAVSSEAAATDAGSEDVQSATDAVDAEAKSNDVAQTQTSETLPEDSIGEPLDSTQSKDTTQPKDSDVTLLDDKPAENTQPAESTQPAQAATEPKVESNTTPAMPAEPSAPPQNVTELTPATEAAAPAQEKPKAVPASLQKVATKPWKVGKTWFNAVYFARPGDTLKSISKNIYGSNKSAILKKGNPYLASRGVKPGDKVYYNSPKRPDDSENMQSFYEENGVSPEVYVSKAGDDIKKISKELLGYDNAWKEVWASNLSVESKGELPEGTELRYWKTVPTPSATPNIAATTGSEHAAPVDQGLTPPPAAPAAEPSVAKTPPPMPTPAQEIPPPPMPQQTPDMAATPPPPPEIPPPPAQDMAATPPPPPEIPPPPAPKVEHKAAKAPEKPAEDDIMALLTNEDNIMIMGAAAIAIAGAAALLVIRKKKKQREIEEALSNTQVG